MKTLQRKEFEKVKRFVQKRFPGAHTIMRTNGSYAVVDGNGYSIVSSELMLPPALTVREAWTQAKYAAIQAGRKLLSAERQALNYTIQGNTLLRGMERSNAAVRARAAANGIVYNEGSAASIQAANVGATYRDVGMSDLNALTARILGFEDAGAMILAAKEQAELTMSAAEAQASQLRLAGQFAVDSGGLLSGATLLQGGLNFAQTVRNPFTP